jgi:endo-1,4-beta-xylanase
MSKEKKLSRLGLLLFIIMLSTLSMEKIDIQVQEKKLQSGLTYLQHDFEEGHIQGWFIQGGLPARAVISSEEARGGARSMKITSRNNPLQTPAYDLRSIAQKGKTYKLSVWVKYIEGPETRRFNLTFYKKDGNGEDHSQTRESAIIVSKGQWTKLEASYTLNFEGALETFICYIKISDEKSLVGSDLMKGTFIDYYVDDTIIQCLSEDIPMGKLILDSDFEDGTVQGWSLSGGKLESTTEIKRNGKFGLKISERKTNLNVPTYNLKSKSQRGRIYEVSAWVFYNSGSDSKKFSIMFYKNDGGAKERKAAEGASLIEVSKGEWVKLEGRYELDYNSTLEEFAFYIETLEEISQSNNVLEVFFLDDIVITSPDCWTKTDGAVIITNFEDNTTEGWLSKGSAQLHTVNEQSHDGLFSLKVANRKKYSDLPKYNLKGELVKGKTYKFTTWVKFTGGGPDHRLFNLALYQKDSYGENYIKLDRAYLIPVYKNEWTKLEGTHLFDYDGILDSFDFYIEVADENSEIYEVYKRNIPIVDFYIDTVSVTDESRAIPTEIEQSIKPLYSFFKFPVGAYVDVHLLNHNDVQMQLLTKHFNTIVPQTSMMAKTIQPKEGEYNFAPAERLVEYAIKHNMKLRGHLMSSQEEIPDWMLVDESGNPISREILLTRFEQHIKTVIRHFKNKYGNKNPIYGWDVAGEVFNDKGIMHTSSWIEIIGADYVEKMFKFGREADADTKFFIIEQSLENPLKDAALYILIRDLQSKGVQIDALGYTPRINVYNQSIENIQNVIEKFSSLGLNIEVVKLDMSIYKDAFEEKKNADEDLLIYQALAYNQLFNLFKHMAEDGKLTGITFSALADNNTCLDNWPVPGRKDAPLLFGKDLKAKPSYWALADSKKLSHYMDKVKNISIAPESKKLTVDTVESDYDPKKAAKDAKLTTGEPDYRFNSKPYIY